MTALRHPWYTEALWIFFVIEPVHIRLCRKKSNVEKLIRQIWLNRSQHANKGPLGLSAAFLAYFQPNFFGLLKIIILFRPSKNYDFFWPTIIQSVIGSCSSLFRDHFYWRYYLVTVIVFGFSLWLLSDRDPWL